MAGNLLFYGDNLSVLRENLASESIDLVYLDPPFNSERDYNVLFKEHGTESEAQIRAFEDYWHWDITAEKTYAELTNTDAEKRGVPGRLVTLMESMRQFLGQSDMMAYLVMMAIRLAELRRVLKPTGSLYLHCDPTASHYLKLILDSVFGPTIFKNEIVWKRSSAHSDTKQGRRQYGRIHDLLLFYTKSGEWTWNPQYTPYDPEYVEGFYKFVEPETGRRYRLGDLTGPGGAAKGNPRYEVMGVTRYWRYSKEKMQELIQQGRVIQTGPGVVPAYKRYLDEMPGVPLQDVWTDLNPVAAQAAERLGYPTQKPVALLERMINASSNEGDVVLDPFCGCGTALHAAQRLNRRWIGIDITHLAIGLIRNRLDTAFPGIEYQVHGVPADAEGARVLAGTDPYDFQWWALPLIGARPIANGEPDQKKGKKGMDRGVDGVIRFIDNPAAQRSNRIVVSVKAGKNLSPWMVRDLRGTVERENAPIGVLLSMYEPSAEMRSEAAKAGLWHSDSWGRDYPRIQLITIEEAFKGKRVDYPGRDVTLQAAPTEERVSETLPLAGMKPRTRKKR
ncbi:DNA methyltransferase [Candidatus Binatus sp.]|uniref:DNA methyltransferase n=1 Tax=Candidatus Binatus sp. TaxID=2811406 RepID=UPI002F95BAA4